MIRSTLGPSIYAAALASSFLWPPGAIALQVLALLIFIVGPPNLGGAARAVEPEPED